MFISLLAMKKVLLFVFLRLKIYSCVGSHWVKSGRDSNITASDVSHMKWYKVQIPMPGKEEAVGSWEAEENLRNHMQRRHYSLGSGHHTDC